MGLLPFNQYRVWENLAEAIIVTACKDYRKAYRRYLKRENPENKSSVDRLRHFFRSQWFGVLTSANGDAIVEELEKEVRASVCDPKINRKRDKA